MLGVAAETEFLRLLQVASSSNRYGNTFSKIDKEQFIRTKITKFQKAISPILATFNRTAIEDLETNLNAIQSIIRIASNESGHPTGAKPPSREQVYVYLQLFIPFAKQLMRLRQELKQQSTACATVDV
jgi:hypothetical protein